MQKIKSYFYTYFMGLPLPLLCSPQPATLLNRSCDSLGCFNHFYKYWNTHLIHLQYTNTILIQILHEHLSMVTYYNIFLSCICYRLDTFQHCYIVSMFLSAWYLNNITIDLPTVVGRHQTGAPWLVRWLILRSWSLIFRGYTSLPSSHNLQCR